MNVPLTTEILRDLKSKGYNVLKSNNCVDDATQIFSPAKINDLWKFLESLDVESATVLIEQIIDAPEDSFEGKFLKVY